MHAALMTLVLVTGADYYAPAMGTDSAGSHAGDCGCDAGGQGGGRHGNENRGLGLLSSCFGPMPQTCYSPRYGCYPGNMRDIQRYPAFHGSYYRRPYNYRNVFDYPWHAELHEPTSHFSYNVAQPTTGGVPPDAPPLPPLGAGNRSIGPNDMQTSGYTTAKRTTLGVSQPQSVLQSIR